MTSRYMWALWAACALPSAAQFLKSASDGPPERAAYQYIGRNRTVLPHLAYGAYWHTKITIVNLSGHAVTVPFYFYDDAQKLLQVPIKNYGTLSYVEVYIPGWDTRTIETDEKPGDPLKVGWAAGSIQCPSGGCDEVLIYGSFGTVGVPGRPDFEAALFAADSRAVMGAMAFNNRNGFSTGVAVAAWDCTGTNPDVRINFKYDDQPGNMFYQFVVPTPCPGHTQFSLAELNPISQGKSGYVQVFSNEAKVATLGLLFNPNGGAFTTLPVVEYLK